jgi:outer membrane receptor protein involved in Fe transport
MSYQKKIFLCFFGLLVYLTAPTILQAQDTLFKPTVEELLLQMKNKKPDDVSAYFNYTVKSTTRNTSEKADKAPATIWVITAEQISLRGYQSLVDVLYDVPDLKIDNSVDPRWGNDVSIRGIRGMDKFVILLDGVRISSPTNDIIPVMENYPINFAQQIEIICGPASAQYGADAFSGIINIVSKNPDEVRKNTLSLIGGQYNTYTANLLINKQLNSKMSFLLAGQYHFDQTVKLWNYYPEDYKDMKKVHQTGIFNSVFGTFKYNKALNPEPDQTPVSAYGLYSKLSWRGFKLSGFLNGATVPTTFAGNPNNVIYNYGNFFGHSVGILNLSYEKQINNKWKVSSFLTHSNYWLNPESTFQNVYTSFEKAYLFSVGRMLKAEQLISWSPSSKIDATMGITYENFFSIPRGHDLAFPVTSNNYTPPPIVNSVYPNNLQGIAADLPQVRFSNIGAFLQTSYKPHQNISLVIGTRYDYNSRWGATFNPRTGVVWEFLPKTTLKGLYGTAFLAPSPLMSYDQFGTFYSLDQGTTYQSAFFRLPNPDLKPQLVSTFEIGLNTYALKNFRLNLSGYRTNISGLFSYVPDAALNNIYKGKYKGWDVGFIEVITNQGEQLNYGGSLRIDYVGEIKRSKVNAYFSYSYVDGEVDVDGDKNTPAIQIPAVTPHIFRMGIEYQHKKWQASLRGIMLGKQRAFTQRVDNPLHRQEVEGYFLLNLSTNYRFNDSFTAFIFVKNLLDARYYDVNLGAAPEGTTQGAAANAELANGMPQNPIRMSLGLQIRL